jgi:hypothetical protein
MDTAIVCSCVPAQPACNGLIPLSILNRLYDTGRMYIFFRQQKTPLYRRGLSYSELVLLLFFSITCPGSCV